MVGGLNGRVSASFTHGIKRATEHQKSITVVIGEERIAAPCSTPTPRYKQPVGGLAGHQYYGGIHKRQVALPEVLH
jgi:hypothetical protein